MASINYPTPPIASATGVFVALFFVAVIAGAIYHRAATGSAKTAVRTSLPAAQVIRQAVQTIGSQRHWTTVGHSEAFASFTTQRKPSCGVALILAFFFILPALIYLILGGRAQTLTISVFAEQDGTCQVQASSSGPQARRQAQSFLRSLPSVAIGSAS